MKGLLYKDFCILRKKSGTILLLWLVYSVVGLFSAQFIAINNVICMVAPMLVTTTIYYEHAAKWNRYAAVLPMSAKQIVCSKYLLSILLTLLGFLMVSLSNIAGTLRFSTLPLGELTAATAAVSIVGLCYAAILLPLVYRFGVERARIFSIIGAVMVIAIMFALLEQDFERLLQQENLFQLLAIIIPIVTVVLLWISFQLSSKIYSKYQMEQ